MWKLSPYASGIVTNHGVTERWDNGLDRRVWVFSGTDYLEYASRPEFSVGPEGEFTFAALIKPDPPFLVQQSTGYVHWAGKGEAGRHEWGMRMYGETNDPPRPYRISGYHWNPEGGLGVGAYFQDSYGEEFPWIHVVLTCDGQVVKIYRDGVQRNAQLLSKYDIHPVPGNAPLRIGTRDKGSFFVGDIAWVKGGPVWMDVSQVGDMYEDDMGLF